MPNTLKQNVDRVVASASSISNAVVAKGGIVNVGDGLEEFAAAIASIPTGGHEVTITSIANADVTMAKTGKSYTVTANNNGVAVFNGVESGTYNITASYDGATSDAVSLSIYDHAATVNSFATITLTAQEACTITLTDGTSTKTLTYTGTAITTYVSLGTWTASTEIQGTTITKVVNVENYSNYTVNLTNVTASYVTRQIDFVTKTSSIIDGSIEGHSVYEGMRRCNVADDGTINAFYGDAGYTEDGSNGQVMVYVPKFWYKTNHTNSDGTQTLNGTGIDVGEWSIADSELDGYKLHPAFIGTDGVTELDYFLIGAFEAIAYDGTSYLDQTNIGSSTSYKLSSVGYVGDVPTYRPAHSFTRAVGRASAERRGTGWYQAGFKQISAIQMLFTVELSCNSQKAVGYGITTLGTVSSFSNTSYVGSTVGNSTGNAASTKNSNGTTYTTNGDVSVSYRGIENLWGNIWGWIDGLTLNGYTPYINTGYTFTDTTVGTQLAYNVPSSNYQSKFGYDSTLDWVMLPYSSASESDPGNAIIGDYVYTSSSSNRVADLGGNWYGGSNAGLFYWDLGYASSRSGAYVGSRIMFIPN